MTGKKLLQLLETETDVAFTGYLAPEANMWFRKGFIVALQHIYSEQLNNQNAFDEINFLISTDAVFPLNNNKIYINKLLASNITYVATAITVTTELPHNFIVGDTFTLSGSVFTTNAPNGTFTILTTPDANTFTYTAGATPTGTYTPNTGYITSPKIISDYFHYLDYGKARFTKTTPFSVIGSTNSTPIKITLNKRSYLRDKDNVVISGIAGNTNANGTFYLRQANEFSYFLYTDENLTNAVSGNGNQSGVGTLSQIFDSTLKFKRSQEKGSLYGKPTAENPYFQQSKMLIKILPDDEVCDQIKIDYIIKPPVFIDTADDTTDLSDHYPDFFQYRIVSEAAKLFTMSLRDTTGLQIAQEEIIENP